MRIAATLIGRSQRPRFRTAKMFVVVALSLSLSLGGVLRSSFVSASGVGAPPASETKVNEEEEERVMNRQRENARSNHVTPNQQPFVIDGVRCSLLPPPPPPPPPPPTPPQSSIDLFSWVAEWAGGWVGENEREKRETING